MGPESKSKPKAIIGDLYYAQDDGSLEIIIKEPGSDNPFKNAHLKRLRLLNALSYTLAAPLVLSSIHTSSSDEYDNYEAWASNQTLLSVAPYSNFIWWPIFFLLGLFVLATFVPSLWSSQLLGYTKLTSLTFAQSLKKPFPVVVFPALCASTALTVYSFFSLTIMSLAFVGCSISTFFLLNIIKYQLDNVTLDTSYSKIKGWLRWRRSTSLPQAPDENTLNEYLSDNDVSIQIQQYIFLKLPFELYAGYNLGWNVSLLNCVVLKLFQSAILSEVLAYVSLVLLLCVGCYVIWTKKKGLCFGVGFGLAWYLVGVFFQLDYRSVAIEYAYSDAVVVATKYTAIIIANILVSAIVLRVVKNSINVRRDDEDYEFSLCCCKV